MTSKNQIQEQKIPDRLYNELYCKVRKRTNVEFYVSDLCTYDTFQECINENTNKIEDTWSTVYTMTNISGLFKGMKSLQNPSITTSQFQKKK